VKIPNQSIDSRELRYDFSKGTNFETQKQPREFINLKTLALKHLDSKQHNWRKIANMKRKISREIERLAW